MNAKHTPGALRAAKIIMGGRSNLVTEYGRKSEEGIADLVDNETYVLELLEACRAMLVRWESLDVENLGPGCRVIADAARAAIAKAEQE
jgi:hypothetical protein